MNVSNTAVCMIVTAAVDAFMHVICLSWTYVPCPQDVDDPLCHLSPEEYLCCDRLQLSDDVSRQFLIQGMLGHLDS